MSVLIFILILSFLVIIHELGHLFSAKWAKIKVEEFGLGYPPRVCKLFSWRKTLFTLNWIPFGGFVKLMGEDELSGKFHQFPSTKRLIVILAGALVNFLYGMIAFSIVYTIIGIPIIIKEPIIAQVLANSPAKEAGLKEKTKIIAIKIEDQIINTQTTDDVIAVINEHPGETVSVQTTGECVDLDCQTTISQFDNVYLRSLDEIPPNQGSMGVSFQPVFFKHYSKWQMPFRGVWYGSVQAFKLGEAIILGLKDLMINALVLRQFPAELAGPIGIVHQASSQGIFSDGLLAIINFSGMLSINLGIMNILPIPALDGGRALFIFIEKIVGKKKSQFYEYYANYIGYIILLGLIIIVTIKDVLAII